MQIVLKDLDRTRIRYEAMVQRAGDGNATLAVSRALNHEGRKSFTAVTRPTTSTTPTARRTGCAERTARS